MSASRAKGTRWERLCRDFLRLNGQPDCDRLAIGGSDDRGDLTGVPGWLVECKAVTRMELGSHLATAMAKAERHGLKPVLLVKRRNHPVARGFAIMPIATWAQLIARWDDDAA